MGTPDIQSMTGNDRDGIILRLVAQMRESGSWGGETHIQKSAFFLQHLLGVKLGYRFVLHLHGPYSFGLRDDLTRLRARRTGWMWNQIPAMVRLYLSTGA